ncbi:2-succinyl-5-enolpyruvyl-6-hydroxy-3-cyclohexene-1-carboxylic-acid synthase [Bizionia gelidisalsuginis]|uniref:2-succinyl-5-enolpyruvyl-6-hydroxy-3-cyclohexene-1-carboxylate synthase n=2 Tax=Bizionia TaxID=283785 RepID=A0A8H2QJ05_9FLAO|nr:MULTISPECIES: 2-succinyl-5-enolpyruvyl-6-hydroxy-3-cyclohexene-1-carboxylic-acid synthase [Bizionia]TYB73077.1 2-succinyl-5-enolpyruvyl-6-hydroxy-3-cyclohexene-1-carboxylic-acid synthase [Bizionia saleffrena]TYC14847.1 2-succinyl-5-enolpyruvyl-6-hydroxy-3-cyclohexene-1-carboxylic-acid synthase [Bizionia gelidisalsuginis]
MKYPKIPLAQTVLALCKAKNIKHIVLSPGSRNAPLTIGFTHDPFFKCYSIVDERCAGFFALGIAQQLQEPVAVVCTSGSALLNYYPAVSEAFYSTIPLVVLSTDRPQSRIGIGDGQTINQQNVYANHILYSANLTEDSNENMSDAEKTSIKDGIYEQSIIQKKNEIGINEALNRAILKQGPVHINIPFNEPLYDIVEELSVAPKNSIPTESTAKDEDLSSFVNDWNTAKRKLVLVGVSAPNIVEQQYLDQLAADESVLVLTESTSNIHHKNFIPGIDKLIGALTCEEFETLQPDLLLTFGGLVISKKIKQFLRKYQPKQHWHIGEHTANDTFFILNKVFKYPENEFFSKFLGATKSVESNYQLVWLREMESRREKHSAYVKAIPFSDFKVFDSVLESIPSHSQLQIGNSSAIRYAQLFDLDPTLKVFCNRGTSGIDGSTSTAIGAAVASKVQTVFITGDLSFFYDSNALWNNYIPNNFRIIIINNSGGGIFRILPGHKNTENFDTYFETKHHLTAKQLCEMYHLDYQSVSNNDEVQTALKTFYEQTDKPRVLEIATPSTQNDEILLKYFSAIK